VRFQSRERKEEGVRRYATRVRAKRVPCMSGDLHAAPATGHQGLVGAAPAILGAGPAGDVKFRHSSTWGRE
jgi:hypothetical protein